ncbi:autotransporter outer membrane beta-barrel domain-containing protein [Stenotrophomonas oahuensis]|uniref:Autotransporter outer membrane beta-barrel domain-containing protein n=1 Tax=Stenotrophomonas oahuensis TaxID=3003271 RepID=A0ABY9YIZ3_9GAMM|nr:autotransporter outer membrane beta-barrel domain-containing protein [Stenotrophomonas sp. A5586]WNH50861.1 autotransporter outer membrane beta-barrel domain-containing protein [Stenotrophomonas sp. A5586]
MLISSGAPHRPALRPLACGVLFALVAAPLGALHARELDNQHVSIDEGHAVEAWRLINGASLQVRGATTHTISVNDTSALMLSGATVIRNDGPPTTQAYALQVLGNGTAIATNSRFVDGGVWVAGRSSATLTDSHIEVRGSAPGFDTNARPAWGLSINDGGTGAIANPSVVLDNSRITVADRADQNHYSSGVGAYITAGTLTLRNDSVMDAANVGVVVVGAGRDHPINLELDGSHIQAGRASGIEFAGSGNANAIFNVIAANGSTIKAADGNLLLVRHYKDSVAYGDNQVNFTVSNSSLQGNVVFDDSQMNGRVNVVLEKGTRLRGVFDNVTSARIGSNSIWTLTGDSTVGDLTLDGSAVVRLSDRVDAAQLTTLTLENFHGAGGTFMFRTVLDDDSSATDKLHITGDAEGHAGVVVLNAGGQGAQTANGIELITIDGASNAQFDLLGRAVGGQYEYFLIKGDDGNWYLRSQLDEQPDVPHECLQNPELPHCEITLPVEPIDPEYPDTGEPPVPQPVLRPETGAYLANQAAMHQLLQHSAQRRMANDATDDGLRTWASTEVAESRQQLTGQQRFESTRQRLQLGADIGVFDGGQGRVGAMLSAGKADATVRSTVTGYRAEATVEGGAVGAYAHWSNDAQYLDASVQHGRFRNTVHGEGLDAERYDSRAWQSAVEAGYRFDLGGIGGMALNLQPQLQLIYTDARTDAHVESNGTVVRSSGASGLSTRVGLRLEGETVIGSSRFAPYVAINGYRDTRHAGMVFDGETVLGGVPRQRAELNLGGQLQLSNGLSAWSEVGASHGETRHRDTVARIGAAYRW